MLFQINLLEGIVQVGVLVFFWLFYCCFLVFIEVECLRNQVLRHARLYFQSQYLLGVLSCFDFDINLCFVWFSTLHWFMLLLRRLSFIIFNFSLVFSVLRKFCFIFLAMLKWQWKLGGRNSSDFLQFLFKLKMILSLALLLYYNAFLSHSYWIVKNVFCLLLILW